MNAYLLRELKLELNRDCPLRCVHCSSNGEFKALEHVEALTWPRFASAEDGNAGLTEVVLKYYIWKYRIMFAKAIFPVADLFGLPNSLSSRS